MVVQALEKMETLDLVYAVCIQTILIFALLSGLTTLYYNDEPGEPSFKEKVGSWFSARNEEMRAWFSAKIEEMRSLFDAQEDLGSCTEAEESNILKYSLITLGIFLILGLIYYIWVTDETKQGVFGLMEKARSRMTRFGMNPAKKETTKYKEKSNQSKGDIKLTSKESVGKVDNVVKEKM